MKQQQPRRQRTTIFSLTSNFRLRKIVAASAAICLVYSVVVLKPAIENELLPRERENAQLRGGDDTLNLLAETENIWLRPNLKNQDSDALLLGGEVSFHIHTHSFSIFVAIPVFMVTNTYFSTKTTCGLMYRFKTRSNSLFVVERQTRVL